MKFLKSLPKEKLQRLILAVVGSLIVIGCALNFYTLPKHAELAAKQAEFNKLNGEVQEAQNAVKDEVANTALRNTIQQFIANQDKHTIEGDPFSWVVRETSLLAEKHPVRVAGLIPGAVGSCPGNPAYEAYAAKFDVEGSFDEIGQFISAWENTFTTSSIQTLGMVLADAALIVPIGAIDDESARLIEVTRSSLEAAIRSMTVGSTLGAIGAAVSEVAEAAGMSIVREYTGHGIGTAMHEEPAVPNYPNGPGHRTKLKSGLVLAVEPMVTLGRPTTRELDDGWTVVTVDGSRAAHFEHTIAITDDGPEVLTLAG